MKVKTISTAIATASNFELTAKVLFGFDKLSATEKAEIRYILQLRADRMQTTRQDMRRALEKLSN